MTTDSVQTEPVIDMTREFHWGEVASERHHGGILPKMLLAAPDLGGIAGFTGKFAGNGFNVIFRPQDVSVSATPLPNPAQGPSDNILQLNLTEETLDFSAPLGSIPNRGFAQGDIFLNGIPYVQKVNDVTGDDKVGIHFEPGVWLSVPPTTTPGEDATIVRMASIPHGTTIDAQGKSFTVAGGPQIATVDITPFPIGDDQNDPTKRLKGVFPSQTADDDHTFRLPQDLTPFITAGTITQDMLDDPNSVLRNRAKNQNITSTTVIQVDTKRPEPLPPAGDPAGSLFGGGTANIAFLLGDQNESNPNANAVQMSATFWIETVTERITVPPMGANQIAYVEGGADAGEPVATFRVSSATEITDPVQVDVTYSQIQYTQTVLLNFATLSWPHVSVANLVPCEPIQVTVGGPSDDLLNVYTVVAGDTLVSIAQHFYGDTSRVAMLAAVNQILDPNLIHVGQVLIIPDPSHTHTVVAGDTLVSIAQHFYGDTSRVAMLAAVNQILDPNLIHVGQVLVIPDLSHTDIVGAGDTLFGIAQHFYGHGSLFKLIAAVNGITNPNTLNTGQVLAIPRA